MSMSMSPWPFAFSLVTSNKNKGREFQALWGTDGPAWGWETVGSDVDAGVRGLLLAGHPLHEGAGDQIDLNLGRDLDRMRGSVE